jgi:hypothetical protein
MPNLVGHSPGTSAVSSDADGEVFEIFQLDQRDSLIHHGGNLRAPDNELAIHYAREFYGRRQESQKLWIIPRVALWEIRDVNQFPPVLHALAGGDTPPEGYSQARGTFAVFGQKQAGKPLVWLQDLEQVSLLEAAEAAVRLAHSHANEQAYLRLWLCPRNAIDELTNSDLLNPPLDRSYRRLDGYNIREKLRIARQRVQAEEGKRHA